MSTPAKSFEDLRSILGKLDRKIDTARSRRLGLDMEPVNGSGEDGGPMIGKAEEPEAAEGSAGPDADSESGEGSENGPRRRSPYGRAKPLNRGGNGSVNGSANGTGHGNGSGPGWLGGS